MLMVTNGKVFQKSTYVHATDDILTFYSNRRNVYFVRTLILSVYAEGGINIYFFIILVFLHFLVDVRCICW